MRKIVPFNNVLEFRTDVCEITAISLEHKIRTEDGMISGEFYINGEYKITDGQLERDKFNFELPFDIALGNNYDRNTLIVDIDDFRYEIVDRNKLKVNIDLYIDGEIVPEVEVKEEIDENVEDRSDKDEGMVMEDESEVVEDKKVQDLEDEKDETLEEKNDIDKEEIESIITQNKERIDLLDEMLMNSDKENKEMNEDTNINNENNNENENINIFSDVNGEDSYVTYRVYRVDEGDTIDKIIEKYNTSKEELEKYNNIIDINIGDKLIIPANDK